MNFFDLLKYLEKNKIDCNNAIKILEKNMKDPLLYNQLVNEIKSKQPDQILNQIRLAGYIIDDQNYLINLINKIKEIK